MKSICLAAILLLVASTSSAIDILIPGDYPTIQQGINAALATDRVLVSPGTWTERITLRDSVDVVSTLGPEVTILDGESMGRVVIADSVTALFEGFTITNGLSPTNGAGMNVTGDGYELHIENCVFTNNTAAGQGGGLAVQNATALVGACTFTANTAAGGAGVFVFANQVLPVRIDDCDIYGNSSTGPGGGIFVQEGSAELSNLRIHDNTTTGLGGGVAGNDGDMDIGNCVIYANAADEGGGVSYHNSSTGTVSWCTLYANDATVGAGLSCTNDSSPTISRTLITASTGTGAGMNCGVGSTPLVECSDLWGNAGGDAVCGNNNGDNISMDPGFCRIDPLAEGNFSIQSDSPCAPAASPCALLIGAGAVDCGVNPAESATWGQIKNAYR